MSKKVADGLARLQNQSRIPASKWREWCILLGLDPIDAVETWEEICYPIMVATSSMPVQEISYILQMRTARPELDVFDFKEEVPKVLHAITFIYNLKDERLMKGKVRSSILKFYKRRSSDFPVDQLPIAFVQRFIVELCSIVLVAKTLRGPNITLSGALKPVIEGQGTFGQLLGLAAKSLSGAAFDDMVRPCLTAVNPDQNGPLMKSVNGSVKVSASPEPADEADDADDDEDIDDDEIDGDSEGLADASQDPGYDDEDLDDDEDVDDDFGEEEEDLRDDDEDPVTMYLTMFKTALRAIYEAEAESGDGSATSEAVLGDRFKTITAFNPMNAVVPALEEAQAIARRLEAARNPNKPRKASVSISSVGGAGVPSGPMSSAGAAVIAKGTQISDSRRKTTKSEKVASSTSSKRGDGGEGAEREQIEVESRDVVDLTPVSKSEFSDKVREIGAALGAIAPADQIVWNVFLEPGAKIDNLKIFARTLSKEGSGQFAAYNALKRIGMLLPVKELLSVADRGVLKNRNFTVEVTTFMNTMKNSARELAPDNRQLAPLVRILDNAAAALLRLEAIRVNQIFSEEHPEEYNKQSVLMYYEEGLRSLTDLTDREVLGGARSQADADTVAMLEAFGAKKYADAVVGTCKLYVQKLKDDGHTKSAAAATTAMSQDKLSFTEAVEGVEANPEAGSVPADLVASSGLGDTFDEVSNLVITQAWAVLQPVHEPTAVAVRIQEVLRQILVSTFKFQPEKKRHQENPKLAINVVSLDKICGKQGFVNLCVRVGDDGKGLYVEGYEDGSYVDLFELREYKPSRMRAKEKTGGAEEDLQTGRKYMYTVGRTNRLFGESPSDVINGCVRGDDGTPKSFPVF